MQAPLAQGARDHGGNLDAARARFGGQAADWLDLSTGINPYPYPVPQLAADVWARLPDASLYAAFEGAARRAYHLPPSAGLMACNGAQGVIQLLPRVLKGTRVSILSPTYNEHAASFRAQGWDVHEGDRVDPRADVVVAVSPNNPDGRVARPEDIALWQGRGQMVVLDESFADPQPALSHMAAIGPQLMIMRSFGKFFGLAGVRLGALVGTPEDVARAKALSGPWAVSGPALSIGAQALADTAWQADMRAKLEADSIALAQLLAKHGLNVLARTPLFVLLEAEDAAALQDKLARAHIWSRIFPYNPRWMRLGLPAGTEGLKRLAAALS